MRTTFTLAILGLVITMTACAPGFRAQSRKPDVTPLPTTEAKPAEQNKITMTIIDAEKAKQVAVDEKKQNPSFVIDGKILTQTEAEGLRDQKPISCFIFVHNVELTNGSAFKANHVTSAPAEDDKSVQALVLSSTDDATEKEFTVVCNRIDAAVTPADAKKALAGIIDLTL